jgi:hypothetical protein
VSLRSALVARSHASRNAFSARRSERTVAPAPLLKAKTRCTIWSNAASGSGPGS